MLRLRGTARAAVWLPFALLPLAFPTCVYAVPPKFVDLPVGGVWNQALGAAFAADGRMYVWEKPGLVWLVESGGRVAPPVIDLHEEVGNWGDHGLTGVALDPHFLNNGYIYLYYTVDYHHLLFFGTPLYDPNENWYYRDTIARVVRYRVRAEDGYRSIDPDSRVVLIGESIDRGIPILAAAHGVGSLAFGSDGTLLVSVGDSASYVRADVGGPNSVSSNTGLKDGIIQPKEDVGAFRAQLVDSLCGKVLRINPDTGDGVPSNPWYDATEPRAPRSRVWALGFRMPFRITVRPGTGSDDPTKGRPGSIYIGDVGWTGWEELDICRNGGENFGWPMYEGMEVQPLYYAAEAYNLDAPNPLYDDLTCTTPYFAFRDLILQDTQEIQLSFPNPCDANEEVPFWIPRFVHRRPAIDWGNPLGPSRVATWTGGEPTFALIGAPRSPVSGAQFGGASSIAGAWYTGEQFGEGFANTYFHGDFARQWIRNFKFDAADRPQEVREFIPDVTAAVVGMSVNPVNGGLYYVAYSFTGDAWVRHVARVLNVPPVAVPTADVEYGPTPLTVHFDGSLSSDAEDGRTGLSYEWDFGDGSPLSTEVSPANVYQPDPAAGWPAPVRRDVRLTVRDSGGEASTAWLLVSLDNTPPVVTITSPPPNLLYSMADVTVLPLAADIADVEHGPDQLACQWRTLLHHNTHAHPEPADPNCTTETTILPVGCDGETYFYEVLLTVSDAAGLSTSQSVFLYPDCNSIPGTPPVCHDDEHGHHCEIPDPPADPPPGDTTSPGRGDLCGGGLCGAGASGAALCALTILGIGARRRRGTRR